MELPHNAIINTMRNFKGQFINLNLQMPSKVCIECEKTFYKVPSYSSNQWVEQSCCSKKCQYVRHGKNILGKYSGDKNPFFGKKHSDETLLKMRGRKLSEETIGRIKLARSKQISSGMKGLKHSVETLKKMSLNRIGKAVGKDNPNWKGGSTPINLQIRHSLEYKLFREAVFLRDNFTCHECNQRGGRLNVHHIKPFSLFPELRFAIDNGVTLCFSCHTKTDSWGNRIKNNKI